MTAGVRERRVDVGDGELAVTEFGPPDAPAVLAIHGVTSSSRAWLAFARHLPEVRLVAPDLRGRGRSRDLPPSTGLRHHALDLGRLIDAFDLDSIPVVGHSMGAFVAVALTDHRPDAVASLLLVDGGYPLQRPAGLTDEDLATALGPIAARLARAFPTRESYQDFWREHPAFLGAFTSDIAEYADYDLVGEPPHLRTASTIEAISADSIDLYGPEWYLAALARLGIPAPMLRAPRGLLDEPGGLYPELPERPLLAPTMRVTDVDDVNHYTILMTDPGAGIVADALRPTLTEGTR
jgi:lipase